MKKIAAGALVLVATAVAALLLRPGRIDFRQDVEPIVRARCASCHRPGGGAPFSLLGYADVKARAELIADLTRRRIMPPWMPERGEHAFENDRSLSDVEIATLGRWVREGAAEGAPDGSPPAATPSGSLETEDLVVTLPTPYALPAGGPDLYRNFVVPLPLDARRQVRAWEFRPGNTGAVHHAFFFFDRTGEATRLDLLDPEPGFAGLHVPRGAQAPAGHFLSWQPGTGARRSGDYPWPLEPGAVLVIQAHLRPTGKPELVQPSVAFSFTDRAAPKQPAKIGLWSYDIDIPPGAAAHAVKDAFTLPADVDVLGLLPHAHFLAASVEARARRPDGTSTTLLRIPRWNFDWQGDYVYRDPVFLPKGTEISMEIVYDNRAENPRQASRPPRRVRYGVESGDEMAEVWLRVLPRAAAGAALLEQASVPKVLAAGVSFNRYLLERDPGNGRAQAELGKVLVLQGRIDEADPHLDAAIRLRPDDDDPHYYRGLAQRKRRRLPEALASFQAAVRLNPSNAKAHGNLGLVQMERGELDAAVQAFEAALRLDPSDRIARESLQEIAASRRK